jgi:hypothetical protein
MCRKILLTALVILCLDMFAQKTPVSKRDSGLIQFSGMLLSADSLKPIPFASVSVVRHPYGSTYANLEGYFSFVAKKGDTVLFTHVEFQNSYFIIPDTIKDYKYSIVKLMVQDTIYFPGVNIMPMPNRATFDHFFVTTDIPNDDVQRAKNNLEREAMKDQAASLSGTDATAAYRTLAQSYAQRSYYAGGQIPPMNLLNPFAWAQFFEAWKRGDYKRKTTPVKR